MQKKSDDSDLDLDPNEDSNGSKKKGKGNNLKLKALLTRYYEKKGKGNNLKLKALLTRYCKIRNHQSDELHRSSGFLRMCDRNSEQISLWWRKNSAQGPSDWWILVDTV